MCVAVVPELDPQQSLLPVAAWRSRQDPWPLLEPIATQHLVIQLGSVASPCSCMCWNMAWASPASPSNSFPFS